MVQTQNILITTENSSGQCYARRINTNPVRTKAAVVWGGIGTESLLVGDTSSGNKIGLIDNSLFWVSATNTKHFSMESHIQSVLSFSSLALSP